MFSLDILLQCHFNVKFLQSMHQNMLNYTMHLSMFIIAATMRQVYLLPACCSIWF